MSRARSPIYLAGPTGSGKTAVSIALAEIISPAEIINADAFQAYRGLERLSAAPTPEELAACPHHLFGERDLTETNDAASFAKLALSRIAEVGTRAHPIVVGGSGLYLKAITHGFPPLPQGDPGLRASLEKQSLDTLVEQYRELDPAGAAATNLKNRRYVMRNLEICLLTGRPASDLKREWADKAPRITAIYLHRDRSDLDRRIAARTAAMFAGGVVDEVAALGAISPTAAKAIGLAEIRSYLAKEIDETACREAIRLATRRYAKRQETWFRREKEYHWLEISAEESPRDTAMRIVLHLSQLSDDSTSILPSQSNAS